MLILTWKFISSIVIPYVSGLGTLVFYFALWFCIILGAISLLSAAVGVRTHFSIAGPILNAVISGIGYIGRTLISAIGWMFTHLLVFIPIFYRSICNSLISDGMTAKRAKILAILATVALIVVII